MAVPSLLYSAPASATEISKPAYILASYNANVANVVQLINNINNTTATFQTNLEALKAYNALTETEKQYVTNYSTLSAHQQTRIAYRKLADKLKRNCILWILRPLIIIKMLLKQKIGIIP